MKTIIKFIQEARTELAKVTWPSRQTVINLTLVVIGVSLVFVVFISGVDYLFTTGVKYLTTMSATRTGQSQTTGIPGINVGDIDINTE